MKILHLNASDHLGGAARVAYRLHRGLLHEGHHSRMLVGYRTKPDSDIRGLVSEAPYYQRLAHRLVWGASNRLSLQYLFQGPIDPRHHPFVTWAQVINLHNTHGGYLSHTLLPTLCRLRPVVWTLLDMWALTGHCIYSYNCRRWETGCGHCPLLSDYPSLSFDTTAWLWKVKQHVYARSNFLIVTPSNWLKDLVSRSPLLGHFSVCTIPLGLDATIFQPIPKVVARKALDLPVEAKVVLFAAAKVNEPRKGATYLLQALQKLAHEGMSNLWLLVAGEGPLPINESGVDGSLRIRYLGNVSDESQLARCYAAADIFVGPSLAEIFGQVFIEAMACGTPCVAFRVEGVPEVVRHMETGYLASPCDVQELSEGMRRLLIDEELRIRFGRAGRRLVEQEYTLATQVHRYTEVYTQALEGFEAMMR